MKPASTVNHLLILRTWRRFSVMIAMEKSRVEWGGLFSRLKLLSISYAT